MRSELQGLKYVFAYYYPWKMTWRVGRHAYAAIAPQTAMHDPSLPLNNNFNSLPSLSSSLPPLSQSQFPNVKFWRRTHWEQSKLNKDIMTVNTGVSAKKNTLLYIEDANGAPIDGPRATEIRKRAREIFLKFKTSGTSPKTWTQLDLTSLQYYRVEMCTQFPELRFCEQDWKADKVAIDTYSGWYRNQTKSQTKSKLESNDDKSLLKRSLPSDSFALESRLKKLKVCDILTPR
jgi:hypothetical protein